MRKSIKVIVSIVGALLVVLIIGGIIGIVKKQESKNAPTPTPTPDTKAFYLVGTMNDWKWSDDYKFSSITVSEGSENVTAQYKLTVPLDENAQVKIWKGNGDWTNNNYESDWEYATRGENLTITQSGTYNFYLKFYNDGGSSVWVEKVE